MAGRKLPERGVEFLFEFIIQDTTKQFLGRYSEFPRPFLELLRLRLRKSKNRRTRPSEGFLLRFLGLTLLTSTLLARFWKKRPFYGSLRCGGWLFCYGAARQGFCIQLTFCVGSGFVKRENQKER